MLDGVTHFGVSSTDGTAVLVLRVGDRAVHQRGRRRLAGPQVHGQRHGGLGLQVDRLVDGAALVAGQDVLQPDERSRPAR